MTWIETDGGYSLTLNEELVLVCRNAKGKELASVPKKVKDSDEAEQLLALRDWLALHKQSCAEQVGRWMQRSLQIPVALIEQVWADPCWRGPLQHAVVRPPGDDTKAGFLADAAPGQGLGVIDLDGETLRITTETVELPHPILLNELDDWRELAADLGLEQGVPQLHRETWVKPAGAKGEAVSTYAMGKFEQLRFVHGRCRTLGYKVSGGFALSAVWEDGKVTEARYWIGSDDPESEAWTGDLIWVDADQKAIPVAEVGAVAFSEGHRMAAAIYAARKVETEGEAS